ncbi:spore germination protein GerPC [Metabacillus idriensis]|uniref:spore germination protein GerPC n=1 Tax=Metabacillus idriensis TaxID=324768 RepID=UPI0028148E76|nr:spore germination protein GerPC [Metabacillus idriensis]MDR0136368.1 spore germination protein GerPC [Metabacillus idriensis]
MKLYYDQSMMQCIQHLYGIVQAQDEKIKKLESAISAMMGEIEELKKRPSTTIEKIEYKFDQLKVETLEGTLNIGLNPTVPDQIDNFEVDQKGLQVNKVNNTKREEEIFETVQANLLAFLNEDCVKYIEQIAAQTNYELDDAHKEFIIEDIRKQIDSRIRFYLKQGAYDESIPVSAQIEDITSKVKQDVERSITYFIQALPQEGADSNS